MSQGCGDSIWPYSGCTAVEVGHVAQMAGRWSLVPGDVCSGKGVPRGRADGPLAGWIMDWR